MRLIDGDVGSLWEGHSGGGARRAVDQRGLGPVGTIHTRSQTARDPPARPAGGDSVSTWRDISDFSNMRFQTKATAVSTAQVLPMVDSGYIGL